MLIHPTAVVSPRAELMKGVQVGPYAVVEEDVVIGPGCEIAAHAAVKRFTSLGARNRVFEHATLGGEPQDVKFRGEQSYLRVGRRNFSLTGAAAAAYKPCLFETLFPLAASTLGGPRHLKRKPPRFVRTMARASVAGGRLLTNFK